MSSNYQDLCVWQDSMDLAERVYAVTEEFPKREWYGLTQQIRRAVVSVASNIAEGKGRRSDRDFLRFLFTARGSLFEVETQLALAGRLRYLQRSDAQAVKGSISTVARSLTGLINSMSEALTAQAIH